MLEGKSHEEVLVIFFLIFSSGSIISITTRKSTQRKTDVTLWDFFPSTISFLPGRGSYE